MAVAVLDDWSGQTAGSPGGSLTISSGSDRLLWVVYFQEDGSKTFTSMTVGGQSPTGSLIETATNTVDGAKMWSWYWDETAIAAMSGSTVSFSFSGSVVKHDWDYIVFSGAAGGAAYATTTDVASATNQDISQDGTASTADDFIALAIQRSAANRDVTAYDNLTEGWQFNTDYTIAVADGAGGDDTITLTGDGFSGDWFVQCLHVISSGGGGGSGGNMLKQMLTTHTHGQ